MESATQTAVYRVCASGPGRWEVFHEPHTEPVAAFDEKSAALTYAMDLARGRASWQLLLGAQRPATGRSTLRH